MFWFLVMLRRAATSSSFSTVMASTDTMSISVTVSVAVSVPITAIPLEVRGHIDKGRLTRSPELRLDSLNRNVQHRHHKQAEYRSHTHPTDNRGPQRLSGGSSGASGNH